MKVVVGSVNYQINFFQDQIEIVEFNFYWGVLCLIIVNEMLLKLCQDLFYFDCMGYEVSVCGKVVLLLVFDWGCNFDVDVCQLLGNVNVFGQLKILFFNKFFIYMYDILQKFFFVCDMWVLSYGCVCLFDLCVMVVVVFGVDKDKVVFDIVIGKNMLVFVFLKILVYVVYFMVWLNVEGKVEFFDDVYGCDIYLQCVMDVISKVCIQG